MALAEPSAAWPVAFPALATRVRAALGDAAASIEHVGSTAVPGLVAKPIVDIAVGLAPEAGIGEALERLAAIGLEYRGDKGDDGGHLFVLNTRPQHRVAHVHVVIHGDACWCRYLIFRDRLRADPAVRTAYADLKRRLAEQFPHDRPGYTAARASFIASLGGDGGEYVGP